MVLSESIKACCSSDSMQALWKTCEHGSCVTSKGALLLESLPKQIGHSALSEYGFLPLHFVLLLQRRVLHVRQKQGVICQVLLWSLILQGAPPGLMTLTLEHL